MYIELHLRFEFQEMQKAIITIVIYINNPKPKRFKAQKCRFKIL